MTHRLPRGYEMAILEVRNRRRFRWCLGLLLALVTACADSTPAERATVVDSAGITIVTSPASDRLAPFALAAEPALTIGALDGPPEYTFRRIEDVDRLRDGRIVVADWTRIALYDSAGRHLADRGGSGRGPGEFTRIENVIPCGAGLAVGDAAAPHVTFYDSAGRFVQTVRLHTPGSRRLPKLLSCAPGGRPVVASRPSVDIGDDAPRWVRYIMVLDTAAGRLDTVMSVPGSPLHRGFPPPFSPFVAMAARDTAIHTAYTGVVEVRTHTLGGGLRRIARVSFDPRPITEDDVERAMEEGLGGLPPQIVERIGAPDPDRAPPTMPAIWGIQVDEAGRLWVEPYRPRWEPRDSAWTVLDADGTLLGRVFLPPRFRPYHIGTDRVTGVWRDTMDVEYVRMYRLRPRESP